MPIPWHYEDTTCWGFNQGRSSFGASKDLYNSLFDFFFDVDRPTLPFVASLWHPLLPLPAEPLREEREGRGDLLRHGQCRPEASQVSEGLW